METHLSKTLETHSGFQETLDESSMSLHKETLGGRSLDYLSSDPNGCSPISAIVPYNPKILGDSSSPIDSSTDEIETLDDNNQSLVHYGPLPRDNPSNVDVTLDTTRTQEIQSVSGVEVDQNEGEEDIYGDIKPSSSYRRYYWESLSHQSNSLSQSEKQWPIKVQPTGVGAGLENLGNTCFINAILQCFTHTVPLVEGLRSCNHVKPCRGASEGFCVICALRDHIELSLASSGKVVSPWKLFENLNQISSSFERYQQEDAHEFLQCLLDRLERCCLDSKKTGESLSSQDDNIVDRIFGGRLISKLRCCNCDHCSDTYEPLIDLSLEIEDVDSLESALESFTKLEKIEDAETKFTCENCKEQVSVEKQLMLDKVPSIAAFHLKRFKTDGSYVVKIDKHVKFPLELDLQPYTSGGQISDVELKYHLYAIVEHTGSLPTCGHYFSYIRSSPDTWHRLNDSRVTKVEEEYVLSQDAYILFYAKQGTPWFSSLLEAEKISSDLDLSNSSPKSVLDNMDGGYASYSRVATAENCNYDESRDYAGSSLTKFSCELRSKNVEGNETRDAAEEISECFSSATRQNVAEVETRDDTPMIDACRPLGSSDCHDGGCSSDKVNNLPSVEDNNCSQDVAIVKSNEGFRPLTPSRSPSPDVYSGKPSETYIVPREHLKLDHLKLESKVTSKRQFERDEKDSERQEAIRCIKKTMTGSRSMKLMAAINDGSMYKKRRFKSSPCKRTSPTRTRRKHNHSAVIGRVAI